MFCRSCGKELLDGTQFCGNCGTKYLSEEEQHVVAEKNKKENRETLKALGQVVGWLAVLIVCGFFLYQLVIKDLIFAAKSGVKWVADKVETASENNQQKTTTTQGNTQQSQQKSSSSSSSGSNSSVSSKNILANTTWVHYFTNISGDLMTYKYYFGDSKYRSTHNDREYDTGTYLISGDTVTFWASTTFYPSDETQYTGTIIGNSLQINSGTEDVYTKIQ